MAEGPPTEDDVKKKALLRPPNRRLHEEQLEQLKQTLPVLEAKLKSLGRPGQDSEERDFLLSEQKMLKEEKEPNIAKRKTLDEGLKQITLEVSKQSDALSRLEANLAFRTEAGLDDTIRKLQHQLDTRHFKLSEENRIVKEIDSLRRSKKKVKEYVQLKQNVNELRANKKSLKDERDKYFRLVSSLKSKEDAIRQKLIQEKAKVDEAWTRYREAGPEREALKKEIDEHYEKRRQLSADFRNQNLKYSSQQKQQRAHSFKRKEEEKRAHQEARKKEWQDYEASREPYEDERQQCGVLINYLQRFLAPEQDLALGASAMSPVQSPLASSPSLPTAGPAPREESSLAMLQGDYVILKKKNNDDDDIVLQTSAKRKRASRKQSRKSSWLSKPIRHTALIFRQFAGLDLQAPSTMAEVPDSIVKLQAKKDGYEVSSNPLSLQLPPGAAAAAYLAPPRPLQDGICPAPLPSGLEETEHSMAAMHVRDSQNDHSDPGPPPSSQADVEMSKPDKTLPRINIETAQEHRIQHRQSLGGSTPETPNSGASLPLDLKDGGDSVDSGISVPVKELSRIDIPSVDTCDNNLVKSREGHTNEGHTREGHISEGHTSEGHTSEGDEFSIIEPYNSDFDRLEDNNAL